jgi:hypothetical protein
MNEYELKRPTYSISASLPGLSGVCSDAESYVDAWVKRNRVGKNAPHIQMVVDNYDFYCGFVYLLLEGVSKPYKKAISIYL